MASPYPDRRGTPKRDTGDRRRASDALARVEEWMERHDDWARDWSARMESRMTTVESRADLLDGRAGNDDGILGTLGELRGELKGMRDRQQRQAQALGEIRDGVAEVKRTAKQIDGQTKPPEPKKTSEKILDFTLKIILPILLVVIPVVGGIIVAYFQLRGQLAGLQGNR